MKKLTRFKLALLLYVAFDFLIGGHCGGLLPLGEMMAAQSGPPAIGNITSAGSTCSTTSVPTNCVILQLDAASGAATIDISGTWVATLQFEGFTGVTWTNINCTPPNSTTAASSATANVACQSNVAAYSAIRVRASAYTSGTAVVYINSAHASAKSGGGAVYASGFGTSNVIPKGNGAGQLADSACTDNGTTVACTELFIPPATSSATVIGGIGTASNGSGFNFQAAQLQFMTSAARNAALNGAIWSLGLNGVYGWSNTGSDAVGSAVDTGISKGAAGVVDIGTGAAQSTAGTLNTATIQYRGLAQTYFVASNFTSAGNTNLQTITGLSWTFPATTAINAAVDCYINYSIATAAVAVDFGFQDATVAPTNLSATGFMYTSATASTEGTLTASATTTATSVLSATPSAITTIWHAQLHFLIEQPSNASSSLFSVMVKTANASDLPTVYRGSYCKFQQ